MVKKHEKQNAEEGRHYRPTYSCTGRFHTDFTELCRRNDIVAIPQVIQRAIPPCECRAEKFKEKTKRGPNEADDERTSPQPKTYVVKESFEYFKPTVQVKMDNPDKQDTVTEIYIRGWKIDNTMMSIFKQCWPVLSRLHTINLWHAGLSGEGVTTLATFLPQCTNIRSLVLDGNWLKEENWFELIGPKSLVQHLSLRNCFITDKGAQGIGRALGTMRRINTKLLTLNLTGNRITDVGCVDIAIGLRMNRTLLTLSLASNQIGDRGCCKLAESLSNFPLTHEEIVERRKEIFSRTNPGTVKPPNSVRKTVSKQSLEKVKKDRSLSRIRKDSTKNVNEEDLKLSPRKESRLSARKESRKEIFVLPVTGKGSKIAKSSSSISIGSESIRTSASRDSNSTELSDTMKVMEAVSQQNGELWINGNRVLLSLNLSRNRITVLGLQALVKAVQYQTASLEADNKKKKNNMGLLRLLVYKNYFHSDSHLMSKLETLMKLKDPIYKAPKKEVEIHNGEISGSKKMSVVSVKRN